MGKYITWRDRLADIQAGIFDPAEIDEAAKWTPAIDAPGTCWDWIREYSEILSRRSGPTAIAAGGETQAPPPAAAEGAPVRKKKPKAAKSGLR